MNQADIDEAGFEANQWVDIESVFSDGVKRIVHSFRIVPYNIPRGSLAAYYPETNPLVALSSHDKYAKIPASKSVPVILHPEMRQSILTWQQPLTLKMPIRKLAVLSESDFLK